MKGYKRTQRKGLKKRSVRKGRLVRSTRKPASSRVHLFKRLGTKTLIANNSIAGVTTTFGNIVTGSATSDTFGYQFGAAMNFTLNSTDGASELTSLYDRYKISGVKIKIIPLSNVSGVGGLAFLPEVMVCPDYDDATAPTEAQMRQRGAKCLRLDRVRSFFIKPKVAGMLYQTGSPATPGYSVVKGGYINCSYPDVQHYGLKMFFKNVDLRSTSSVATCFNIEQTYYLSMKDPQ